MIESIKFNRQILNKIFNSPTPDRCYLPEHLSFLSKKTLPLFKNNNDVFHFKKGINVIFDRNATGKTTLIEKLAIMTGCFNSGESIYNKDWARVAGKEVFVELSAKHSEFLEFRDSWRGFKHSILAFDIVKDESFTLYCDPRNVVGSIKSHLDIKGNLFSKIQKDALGEANSTGNMNKNRMQSVFEAINNTALIADKEIPIMEESSFEYAGEKEAILNLTKPNISKSVPTILLDEAESALDILAERELFTFLKQQQEREDIQIIMVTHSPLCFSLDKANFITGDLDYLNQVKSLINENNYFKL